METVLFIILSFYFLEHLVFFLGMLKNMFSPPENVGETELPPVTVIVAARNEEKSIGNCIKSLLETDYPRDKLEIFIVDDRSTDKTKDIIHKYAGKFPEIKLIEAKEQTGKLKGKPNALSQAIKKSKGEIILTTDADCIVKASWVKEMVRYYDRNTGVVAGYTIIIPKNIFSGLQSLDWIYLLTVASGSAALNLPLSCVGNNMSYRRKAYEEVGGYENIKFSVTEDFMLLKTIRDKTKWKAKFPVSGSILNYTSPCLGFMELYRQKKRWGRGGLNIRFLGYVVGLLGWGAGAVVLFGWLFTGLFNYLILVLLKTIIDLLFIFPVVIKFKTLKVLLYLPFFEIYFALYAFLLPFILLFDRDVIWKEQKF